MASLDPQQAPLRGPPSRSAQPPKSILKKSSDTASADGGSLFPSSKKDKRRIKHALLIDRVTKSSAKKPKRRRPNKKLITTLDSLVDALPSTDDAGASYSTGLAAGDKPQDQVNIIKRKSMKSRPGAMKRREKLDKGERDRFAKNMAQLATSKSVTDGANGNSGIKSTVPSASERLAALRGFIAQTLETRSDLKSTTAK
ncbi:hypothetical protein A1O3_08662 [Capronia epimyces CBS 606.96]|uniref:Ribosome biogenesis protein SLX9 n=1 Tax=Capronia epimyces CBS 606.96 TaxID=1182542 RepID=W9XQ99_9EURO|nr:uncharacterized protein A1O3_08662 [Capronia epimyces CBS 606.96]EXJ79161.1 hypothetical protein A1O3_08662 [Capronia epimyces CBS 606.96]